MVSRSHSSHRCH